MTTPLALPPAAEDALADSSLAKYINDVIFPQYEKERDRLVALSLWMDGRQPMESVTRTLAKEKRLLQRLAKTPWLGLGVSIYAQAMYVDGYKSSKDSENSEAWEIWNRNNMPAMQIAIHRAAIGYGYAFAKVVPDEDPITGERRAKIHGVSPRRMYAIWDDPIVDDFPQYTFEILPDGKTYRWMDSLYWFDLQRDKTDGKLHIIDAYEHGVGVVPVVRYVNQMDLDGRCLGDVEPVVGLAARIDKTDYDRLLAQHYNSWKVRWATGLEQANDAQDVQRDKLKLAQDEILVSSEIGAKFGSLPETALDPFIHAKTADIESLAAVLQLPANLFTGAVVNVSADALDASRRQTVQKLMEKQVSMGHTHGKLIRLAAAVERNSAAALDTDSRVTWQDVEIRSLAQAADAWGKLVTQLGVPKEFAWARIPGVTTDDVDWMRSHILSDDKVTKFLRELNVKPEASQAAGAAKTGEPASARTTPGQTKG